MQKPKIAAQLYTIRDFTKTPDDLDRSMKRIKEIGYKAVQVSGIGPMEHQQVKDIMDSHGLTICATHVSFARCSAYGFSYLFIGSLWERSYITNGHNFYIVLV
jgi:sugar phosphate isomerase/epimerase